MDYNSNNTRNSVSNNVNNTVNNNVGNSNGILVAVRIRPLNNKEIDCGIKSCVKAISDSIVVIEKEGDGTNYLKSQMNSLTEYQFDKVYNEFSTQQDVYNGTAKLYITNFINGQNVTVFAYGATGAGKSHTMLGNTRADSAANNADNGIIPNAVKDVFTELNNKKKLMKYKENYEIIVNFIEVYNEQVYDLLEPTGKVLSVREDPERGVVVVAGVTEQKVDSLKEVMDCLSFGNKNRKTEATLANAVSSRSHAVLQVILRHTLLNDNGKETLIESKLSLIDLAGSERASATNNRGVRLFEGANINKSLLALANCINALAGNNSNTSSLTSSTSTNTSTGAIKKLNVKYRDSKLTHLLKSSLEGNCNLIMIANINPSNLTYEDSHNTLKYANRAKNIKVDPVVKESVKESNWVEREKRLIAENSMLKERIVELENIIIELQADHEFKGKVLL